MNAHVVRLDALGSRLTQMAGLKDGEFDFTSAPSLGGPEEPLAATEATQLNGVVGLNHVKCIHLNDSQRELGSRVDRHAHIGRGQIGLEGFRLLVNDPCLQHIPMILETPKGEDPVATDRRNLAVLRRLVRGSSG